MILKSETQRLTENEQQEIPLETVAETSKAEEKKTAVDDRTAVPAEDDELVVHATELVSGSNESSSSSALPTGALKNSSKENFKEPVVKEERVEEVKNCFGAKIKEKLARLIKQARTLWDRLRELPGKLRKLADGISKKKISLEKTWNSISMFWHDRQNQKAFHLVWKRAKKLVRYVLPKISPERRLTENFILRGGLPCGIRSGRQQDCLSVKISEDYFVS